MQKVPMNRLLIQPTVQLSWLMQHKTIEFMLNPDLVARFDELWQSFLSSSVTSCFDYLQLTSTRDYKLEDNDQLFALLIGAAYILEKHDTFVVTLSGNTLCWSISD